MSHDKFMHKELVTVVIEKVLLEIGFPVSEAVVTILRDKYDCEISDCYEKPECLKGAIAEYFGNAASSVVEAINRDLANATKNETIEKFLLVLNK